MFNVNVRDAALNATPQIFNALSGMLAALC
jgi:hypothetical protein